MPFIKLVPDSHVLIPVVTPDNESEIFPAVSDWLKYIKHSSEEFLLLANVDDANYAKCVRDKLLSNEVKVKLRFLHEENINDILLHCDAVIKILSSPLHLNMSNYSREVILKKNIPVLAVANPRHLSSANYSIKERELRVLGEDGECVHICLVEMLDVENTPYDMRAYLRHRPCFKDSYSLASSIVSYTTPITSYRNHALNVDNSLFMGNFVPMLLDSGQPNPQFFKRFCADCNPNHAVSVPQDSGALRYDTNKLPYHLLPKEWEDGLTELLSIGAKKYERDNWKKGMAWSRCYSALRRHLSAWWGGEDLDNESGRSHLLHVAWNALVLYSYTKAKKGEDDRPK